MLTVYELNSLALTELKKGNEFSAQGLFQKNAKEHPCCLSVNNLGVFYSLYGRINKKGVVHYPRKLGLKSLLAAAAYEDNWQCFVNVANTLWELQRFLDAKSFLMKAYNLNSNDVFLNYNIGACLYRLKQYTAAIEVFSQLCTEETIAMIVSNGGEHPLLILAYSCLMLQDYKNCTDYLQKYQDQHPKDELMDVFWLRGMCKQYEAALSESLKMLEEWSSTPSLVAMIAECVSYCPSFHASMKNVLSFEDKKLFSKMIKNKDARRRRINKYAYLPPLICQYSFMETP